MNGKITALTGKFPATGEALIYFTFKNNWKKESELVLLNKLTGGKLITKLNLHQFQANEEEIVFCETNNSCQIIFVVGLGERKNFSLGRFKNILASALRQLVHHRVGQVNLFYFEELGKDFYEIGKNLSLSFYLVNYQYDRFRSKEQKKKTHYIKELNFNINNKFEILNSKSQINSKLKIRNLINGLEFGKRLVEGIYLIRDLVNEPASHQHPDSLVKEALNIEKESGGRISVEVLDENDCQKLGMGAFLGVAQGSEKKPKFIILQYKKSNIKNKKLKSICLIGKTIIFDSGGISLKPSKGMEEMKSDMTGGATVLGVFKTLSKFNEIPKLIRDDITVYGILPACENMPSGRAIHPGDIVTAMNGKTIEVTNTDAEGRLALADALVYAEKKFKPTVMIDIATLTGACMVALGKDIAGLFGNNKKIIDNFTKLAEKEDESLWPLPLYKPYLKKMKSDITDLKNVGGTGYAGAITAALFLGEFVEKTPWIHLDIAGPSYNNEEPKGIYGKGGTGWGLTTLIEYIINYITI